MRYTLKQWRKLRDLSRKSLAELVGKTETTIWSWEVGKTEPKASDLENLRNALELSDNDIILLEYLT